MTVKVLLADDHLVVLKGIAVFLNHESMDIVGEAADGNEAVEMALQLQPDVVLMDIHMPGMNGIEACRLIRQDNPNTKVVLFTSSSEIDLIIEALRAGAAGYMLKHSEPEQLVQAILGAHLGLIQLHPDIMAILMTPGGADSLTELQPMSKLSKEQLNAQQEPLHQLTKREREVLELLTQGMSNKEIAEQLVVAEKTVKTHVSSILSKLHLSDRTQAALYAVRTVIDDKPCDCD